MESGTTSSGASADVVVEESRLQRNLGCGTRIRSDLCKLTHNEEVFFGQAIILSS